MPENKYIIYKTINTINGKYYIGKHKIGPRSSHYLGSGTALLADIKKYKKTSFIRKTLFEFTDERQCFAKEAELVTLDVVRDTKCYNIATGGKGGKTQHSTTRQLISNKVKQEWENNTKRKKKTSDTFKDLHRLGIVGNKAWPEHAWKSFSDKMKEHWSDTDYKKKTGAAISKGKLGVKQKKEHKINNAKAQNKKIMCRQCNKYVKVAAYGRWHGAKCGGHK